MTNKQKDALENLKLTLTMQEFKELYKNEISYLRENKILDLKYSQILLTYFLNMKNQGKINEKFKTKNLKVRYATFIRYLKEFIKQQNEYYSERGYNKKIKLSGKTKINKDNYYFYITILGDEQKEMAYSSKKINDIIRGKFVIFIDKARDEILFIGGEKGLIRQVKFLLMRKSIKPLKIEPKELPTNFFNKFFLDENIRIYKIELKNTEISIGDEAIIHSKKGECKKYYQKFLETGILKKENFGVYDIEAITFTHKESSNYQLKFNKKKDYTKQISLYGKNKNNLPKYVQNIVDKDNFWYSKLDNQKMLRILIYNGYIDLYNKSYNKMLMKLVENLELNHFLKSEPVTGYRCKNPRCNMYHRPTNGRICSEENCKKENEQYIKYNKIELDYKKIISKTGNSIKKGGFIQKYKTLKEGAFELISDQFIVRLEDKKGNYAYILFNKDGLNKEDIEQIKRYGLPFLILNFKGELTQDFGKLVTRDAGNLFMSIIKKDFNPFVSALKELSKNLYPIKIDAFEESLKQLKSNSKYSPNDFEAMIFSIFNLMFPECVKWGGPNVADGACIFNSYKNDYLIWDAKRYHLSSLLDYVRNKLEKKDLNYLKKFNKSELVKSNGRLKYYLYVTSNTKKQEFNQIEDEFSQLVKRDRELNKIKLLCIDKPELIKLAEFFKKNQKELINKGYPKFLTILRSGFEKNGGYFSFSLVKSELENYISKKNIVPSATSLRKKPVSN